MRTISPPNILWCMGVTNSMGIIYKQNHGLSEGLYIVDALPRCIPIFSKIFDECTEYDQ